ncbi:MAG: hypothetical protein J7J82_01465 [Staphylothermus sp.]|nr:hypothetical protein [Staphylothermus sp.]
MAKTILLRVYAESANGGVYSILWEDCLTILPIPERQILRNDPKHLRMDKIIDKCTNKPIKEFYPKRIREKYLYVHYDPRLDKGFYTDYYMPRGRLPKKKNKRLDENDLLLFMAGIVESKKSNITKIPSINKSVRNGKAGIFIIGGIIVEEIINVSEIGWKKAIKKYPELKLSPHYYRYGDSPVAVIGKSFILEEPYPLMMFPRIINKNAFKLLGKEILYNMIRNNFRRSRVFETNPDKILKILK